jgi:hypothetical protein
MAITNTQTIRLLGKDISFENSYIKIISIDCDKLNARLCVRSSVNKDGEVIKQDIHAFQPSLDLPLFNQAYLYLKTLPEFATATDC